MRYADDFLILTASEAQAREAQMAAAEILNSLKLMLSPEKTRIASFEEGFVYLGVSFYKDNYTYIWEQKRIQVEGRNTRLLFRHLPKVYGNEW